MTNEHMENKHKKIDDKSSNKLMDENGCITRQRDKKGRLLKGHKIATGRPEGSLNRFTQVKQQFLEAGIEVDVVKKFKRMLSNAKTDMEAMKMYFTLFPKNEEVKQALSVINMTKIIVPKPNDSIDLQQPKPTHTDSDDKS